MSFEFEYKRYEYNLSEDAVVFDVGGYQGTFARNIVNKFKCNVHVFEPIPEFAKNIDELKLPKTTVLYAGLSNRTKEAFINVHADGTSLYGTIGVPMKIQLISLRDYMLLANITHVDLIKINIEGDEFPLLDHMISTGLVTLFDNIQIQFHQVIPDAIKRREVITKYLQNTHKLEWCFDWIWESWKIR